MKKEKETENNHKSIIFLNQNHSWIFGISAGLIAIAMAIFKITNYLETIISYKIYGIDYSFYEIKNIGLFNTVFHNVAILFLLISGIISIYFIKKTGKKRERNKVSFLITFKKNVRWYIAAFSSISFLAYYIIMLEFTLVSFLTNFTIIVISEIIFVHTIEKENFSQKNSYNKKEELMYIITMLPIFIFIIVVCFFISITSTIYLKKEYRLINENKVIVYTNENYYLTLDCIVENNSLTIYYGTQQKVENNLVSTNLSKFEKVIIKQPL